MITQQDLKGILKYDPETGLFVWVAPRAYRVKAGDVAGWSEPGRYVRINLAGRLYYAHRLAFLYMTGQWPVGDLDHINGIRNDNRWSNLREANRSQNLCNRQLKAPRSGVKGVVWIEERKKFRASGSKDGKKIHLGYFDTAEEAHDAYKNFSEKAHGEFFCKRRSN